MKVQSSAKLISLSAGPLPTSSKQRRQNTIIVDIQHSIYNPNEQVNLVVDTILEKCHLFYINWFSTYKCQNITKI
jgi:hypothetical protein